MLQVFVTRFSEVLGLDAKRLKFRQTNCVSSIADFHLLPALLIGLVLLILMLTSLGKLLESIKTNSTCHKKNENNLNNDLSADSTTVTFTHPSSLVGEKPTAMYMDCI